MARDETVEKCTALFSENLMLVLVGAGFGIIVFAFLHDEEDAEVVRNVGEEDGGEDGEGREIEGHFRLVYVLKCFFLCKSYLVLSENPTWSGDASMKWKRRAKAAMDRRWYWCQERIVTRSRGYVKKADYETSNCTALSSMASTDTGSMLPGRGESGHSGTCNQRNARVSALESESVPFTNEPCTTEELRTPPYA